jgi:hypothetical protein
MAFIRGKRTWDEALRMMVHENRRLLSDSSDFQVRKGLKGALPEFLDRQGPWGSSLSQSSIQ